MEALKRACNFCIYQERTQDEVREKLLSWDIDSDETEEIIAWLITENFINESRFAKQYAGSKFRVKRWGRKKILHHLKAKGISRACIQEAMLEIPEEDYRETVLLLAHQKKSQLSRVKDSWEMRQKISTYLLGKGYSVDEFQDLWPEILA